MSIKDTNSDSSVHVIGVDGPPKISDTFSPPPVDAAALIKDGSQPASQDARPFRHSTGNSGMSQIGPEQDESSPFPVSWAEKRRDSCRLRKTETALSLLMDGKHFFFTRLFEFPSQTLRRVCIKLRLRHSLSSDLSVSCTKVLQKPAQVKHIQWNFLKLQLLCTCSRSSKGNCKPKKKLS